jgi:hypothetical protein
MAYTDTCKPKLQCSDGLHSSDSEDVDDDDEDHLVCNATLKLKAECSSETLASTNLHSITIQMYNTNVFIAVKSLNICSLNLVITLCALCGSDISLFLCCLSSP